MSPTQRKNASAMHQKACIISETAWLTPRELEAVRMILFGVSKPEIAEKMGVGLKTVEKMRESAYWKLRVHNTLELLAACLRIKAITSDEFRKHYDP